VQGHIGGERGWAFPLNAPLTRQHNYFEHKLNRTFVLMLQLIKVYSYHDTKICNNFYLDQIYLTKFLEKFPRLKSQNEDFSLDPLFYAPKNFDFCQICENQEVASDP